MCTNHCLPACICPSGGIPEHYSEDMLRPVFAAAGEIVNLFLMRDKRTKRSNRCAFIWYKTRRQVRPAGRRAASPRNALPP